MEESSTSTWTRTPRYSWHLCDCDRTCPTPLTSVSHQGNVYVKCPSIPVAMAAVNTLHGRYFAGKISCQLRPAVFAFGY